MPLQIFLIFWVSLALSMLALIVWNLSRIYKYINRPNPLGQLFYLTLSALIIFGISKFPNLKGLYATPVWDSLSFLQSIISSALLLLTNIVFICACASDPGYINLKNHLEWMSTAEYDYILYSPRKCSTCKFLKIPRSKHCSVCNRCIARQDHHCVWLNNCVGYNNFHVFLLFLVFNWITTTYLAFMGYLYIYTQINTYKWNWQYILGDDGSEFQKFTFVLRYFPLEGGWFIFLVCASILVFLFSVIAIYPAFNGQTLNESIKWEELNYSLNQVPILIEKIVLDCNEQGMTITNDILENADKSKVEISSAKNLKNIYSRGTLRNLVGMIYPWAFENKMKKRN